MYKVHIWVIWLCEAKRKIFNVHEGDRDHALHAWKCVKQAPKAEFCIYYVFSK